ncbi:hypothetical protein BT96DRAFT_414877 [Gymnopus androsaceus JB14]|uniref:Uncharacterized protein n=1 Tax=Gymnopus androsaceus JB14 TaxID=1447944 RepID=A0A6A4GT94_9AGAR|nr:hypothetical protein BT96DRAFT_414877 [Gymnopus androsaceus JB14]
MVIYVLANCCADIILLFRLYHIWESRKFIILPPAFLTAVNLALGIASIIGDQIPNGQTFYMDSDRNLTAFLGMPKVGEALLITCLVVSFFTNVLLTVMIAGRIWWIRRTVTHMGYRALFQQYNTAFAIFVESGIIYPIILLISLITVLAVPLVINIFPILIQVVSIAPMLILVRSGLGVSTEGVQSSDQATDTMKKSELDTDTLLEQKPLYSNKGYYEV